MLQIWLHSPALSTPSPPPPLYLGLWTQGEICPLPHWPNCSCLIPARAMGRLHGELGLSGDSGGDRQVPPASACSQVGGKHLCGLGREKEPTHCCHTPQPSPVPHATQVWWDRGSFAALPTLRPAGGSGRGRLGERGMGGERRCC